VRDERGALTTEWALGAAVVVGVAAFGFASVRGGVAQTTRAIEDGLLLPRDDQDPLQRMQQALDQHESRRQDAEERLRRQQEELAQLQKELDEASDRNAFEDFLDSLFGDDAGAEGASPIRLEAASKWLSDEDDDD
jgi:uncharacterized protein HemX